MLAVISGSSTFSKLSLYIWKFSADVLLKPGLKDFEHYLLVFDLYAEYIMWNDGLDESQAGIKTARRNINNFRYADDTMLMAKSEEIL